MIVSQTPALGLTGRSYTIQWDDDTTDSFVAWCDDEGNEYLAGFSGIVGDKDPPPPGWFFDFVTRVGKTLLDVIVRINPGPTLPAPVPPAQ